LHEAVLREDKDIVELLLANGAHINARNNDGRTPLLMAVRRHGMFQKLWRTDYFLDYNSHMITLSVELEQEDDGRWIAEVAELPGVLAYGENPGDARAKAQALALRVFADRLEHGEAGPDLLSISFKAA
jgi:predicted RNase H-like HicB family nuclease